MVWTRERWLKEAEERTEAFHRDGLTAPVQWVLVRNKNFPQGSIVGGEIHNQPVYISRAFHDGGIQISRAGPQFVKGAFIGCGQEEIEVDTFEVLVGGRRATRWVKASGYLKPDELGAQLVEGGEEADGTLLYVAQAHYRNAVHLGKCGTHLSGAFIPLDGTEKRVTEYNVLVYA